MTASRLRRRLAREAVAASALAVAVAACGRAHQVATRTSPTPSPAPAIARTVAFTVTIPRGWADVTGDASVGDIHANGPVLVVLEKPPQPPVERGVNDVDGIIVVTQVSQPLAPAQVVQYLQSVRVAGATDVTQPVPAMVGGSAATSVTYASTEGGTPLQTQDIVAGHSGTLYEIELITSRHAFPSQAHELDQMLSHGWTWVSGD